MILIADNLRITNPSIQRAVAQMDVEPIREMVKLCEAAGAEAIDINSGPLSRDPEGKMGFLVRTVQDTTDLPIMLDTANPRAIEAGLKQARGRPTIINGFSLQPHKIKEILPLAKMFDADIIGYLLRPDGHVPAEAQERLGIAVELYTACRKMGLSDNQLIIDPVVVPVSWTDGVFRNRELLSVLRNLPDVLGYPVRTIAGLSNLTAGARDREKRQTLENAYLAMLAASGLTMALLDVFSRPLVRTARTCRVLTGIRPFAWGELD